MKYIKTFESYSVNEEFGVAALLAVTALAFTGNAIYTSASRAWSKYVTGSKYEATGKSEMVKNESTGVEFKIDEYQGDDGKIYWGWEHLYNPDADMSDAINQAHDSDLYRAMYKSEDKSRLVRFLKGLEAHVSENPKSMASQVAVFDEKETYVDNPEPVDMIFIDDYDEERNLGIQSRPYKPSFKSHLRGKR